MIILGLIAFLWVVVPWLRREDAAAEVEREEEERRKSSLDRVGRR